MTSSADPLSEAVAAAGVDLPVAHLHALARVAARHSAYSAVARAGLADAVPTSVGHLHARRIAAAWELAPGTSGAALAAALRAAAAVAERIRAAQAIDVVWTGPATVEAPVRATSEVLLQVIGSARQTLIVVAFAAYKVAAVTDALAKAAAAGVDVRLVLETVADSGGKLTLDAASAFKALAGVASFWVWPADQRSVPGGGQASMHAKAAIADEHTALVTSANLTGAAQGYNMELGVLINGGPIPRRLARHYRALMANGVLVASG